MYSRDSGRIPRTPQVLILLQRFPLPASGHGVHGNPLIVPYSRRFLFRCLHLAFDEVKLTPPVDRNADVEERETQFTSEVRKKSNFHHRIITMRLD